MGVPARVVREVPEDELLSSMHGAAPPRPERAAACGGGFIARMESGSPTSPAARPRERSASGTAGAIPSGARAAGTATGGTRLVADTRRAAGATRRLAAADPARAGLGGAAARQLGQPRGGVVHRLDDPADPRAGPASSSSSRARSGSRARDVATGAAIATVILSGILICVVAAALRAAADDAPGRPQRPDARQADDRHPGGARHRGDDGLRPRRRPRSRDQGAAGRHRLRDHPVRSRCCWTTSGRSGTARTAPCTTWPRRRTCCARSRGQAAAGAAARPRPSRSSRRGPARRRPSRSGCRGSPR